MSELLIASGPDSENVVHDAMKEVNFRSVTPVKAHTLPEAVKMRDDLHSKVIATVFDLNLPMGTPEKLLKSDSLRMQILGLKMGETLEDSIRNLFGPDGQLLRQQLVYITMEQRLNTASILTAMDGWDFMRFVSSAKRNALLNGAYNLDAGQPMAAKIATAREALQRAVDRVVAKAPRVKDPDSRPNRYVAFSQNLSRQIEAEEEAEFQAWLATLPEAFPVEEEVDFEIPLDEDGPATMIVNVHCSAETLVDNNLRAEMLAWRAKQEKEQKQLDSDAPTAIHGKIPMIIEAGEEVVLV